MTTRMMSAIAAIGVALASAAAFAEDGARTSGAASKLPALKNGQNASKAAKDPKSIDLGKEAADKNKRGAKQACEDACSPGTSPKKTAKSECDKLLGAPKQKCYDDFVKSAQLSGAKSIGGAMAYQKCMKACAEKYP